MKIEEVYQHFGSAFKAAKELGVSRQAFSNWTARGFIPIDKQIRLEKLTKGLLVADPNHCEPPKKGTGKFYPAYRYYDDVFGMCEVESITFRKNGPPRISYANKDARIERLSSFDTDYLMNALDFLDKEGNRVYVGDILILKDRRKMKILGIGGGTLEKLETLEGYKIIGNIFEKEKTNGH